MRPASQQDIRACMANCSAGEASRMVFPAGFDDIRWENLEYLGWRDPKAPLRGYLVVRTDGDGDVVGIALRAPDGVSRKSVMCTLCHSTHSGGNVALFVARRGGPAGRNGNTVGTYICADLECSRYARLAKPTPSVWPEPGVDIEQRINGLQHRTVAFVTRVLG